MAVLGAILLRVFLGVSLLGAQPLCLSMMGTTNQPEPTPKKMKSDHSCCKKSNQPKQTPTTDNDPCRQRCDEAQKAPTVAPNPAGASLAVLHWAMTPVAIDSAMVTLDQPARVDWPLSLDRLEFISLTDLFHQSCLLTL
ncbi:MAG: hypothetical protein IT447_00055 [Phycisphaerales bacterium]|nr:hypothetical protein [Phycisphaerales bacterium]